MKVTEETARRLLELQVQWSVTTEDGFRGDVDHQGPSRPSIAREYAAILTDLIDGH